MESDRSHLRGTASAITVTTKIVRPESPLIRDPASRKYCSKGEKVEQHKPQQSSAKVATYSKRGSRTRPVSVETMRGNEQPCPSPVIPDTRNRKALPFSQLQSTFEESLEWRQRYDPSSKLIISGGPYLPYYQSGLLPDRSLTKANNSSAETIIPAKTVSEHGSTDTADLGSNRLLCLPRSPSRRNILKAGNIRLKQLIRPKSKTHFKTQPILVDSRDTVGHLQKLDSTASERHLPRRGSKITMEGITNDEIISSQEEAPNKESSTSIVDLKQVEARHGLETYHRATTFEPWDEIFRSMGGFGADAAAAADDDVVNCSGPQSTSIRIDNTNRNRLPTAKPPSKRKTIETRNIPVKAPPLPGPRSSSVTALANGRPTPRSFQVVVAKVPAQPTPTGQCLPKPVKEEDWRAKPDMDSLRAGESLTPCVREARSSEGFSKVGPAPDASQSSIALETIEAEMSTGWPLSPSMLTKSTQPFSINCTQTQPVTAPTDPPIGPLPELPAEFGIADAASRASSHHTSSTRLSRPTVPSRSRHRRHPSVNSASSTLTLRAINAPEVHLRQHPSVSTQNLKKSSSLAGAQSAPVGGNSSQTSPQQTLASSSRNEANITGFNQYNLGNSQDLRSLTASETSQEKEMAAAQPTLLAQDVLSSRSEQIRSLKLRDLAREKATRTRSRLRGSDLDDTIVVEKPSLSAEDGIGSAIAEPAHPPLGSGRPSDNSKDTKTGDPGPAGHLDNFTQRPSYYSRRNSSKRASQRAIRPIMSPSHIMVLAETDPDSQMFRASTPTGSLGKTDSRKAKSVAMTKDRKVRKRPSKSSICSEVHAAAVGKGKLRIKPCAEYTSPHSYPSAQSSDDDVERMQCVKSHRHTNHIVAQVKEDSDIESAPSKRAFAALADIEERKYLEEQLLLTKLKRDSSELKLALRLLSRGLEKLTTFVETDEELNRFRGRGLIEAEMKPVREMSERLERSLRPTTWQRFEAVTSGRVEDDGTGKGAASDRDAGVRRAKSIKANDARPLSVVSRYGHIRHGIAEGVAGSPPVKDEMIWTQLELLNSATKVSGGPSL